MSKLTRRSMLAAVPAMGLAPIVPAMAAKSPHERVEDAFKELEAALMAFDPSIKQFRRDYRGSAPGAENQCRAYLTAYNW